MVQVKLARGRGPPAFAQGLIIRALVGTEIAFMSCQIGAMVVIVTDLDGLALALVGSSSRFVGGDLDNLLHVGVERDRARLLFDNRYRAVLPLVNRLLGKNRLKFGHLLDDSGLSSLFQSGILGCLGLGGG